METYYAFFPLLVFVAIVWGVFELMHVHSRLQGIEGKLSILMRHLNVDIAALMAPSERVKELARLPGSRVPAIKAYREETGADVKEAKRVIDALSSPGPRP